MKRHLLPILSTLITALLLFSCRANDKAPPQPPNIILILADDLGYGELGAYGQDKIETPNIDALAAEGMRFTQYYSSAPVCAPARCMLLTGQHAGQAYIRGNDAWKERGDVWNYQAVAADSTLEGQRPIPPNTTILAHHLKRSGYATGMVGKWGLGPPHTESIPTKMGFDYFFGYNCQRQAHTYYPLHLYENEHRVYLNNDMVAPSTKLPEGADPLDPASYAPFNLEDYGPELMFEKLTQFVDAKAGQPFFLYWATPIPHTPLQAPQRWVEHYVEKFGNEEPYLGENGYFPHRYPHAAYAAMISYLDENVGKLVAQLKEKGVYDNTLILFTSDNGPTYAGGVDPGWFNSAGPFREAFGYGKGFVYEGGIRVPMIASWPGNIPPGTTTDHISAHYDLLSTLADVTGFEKPADTDGISFLPTLLAEGEQTEHDFLYWEFPEYSGQLAIRMGEWKLVSRNLKNDKAEPTLELYNLQTDPTESENVAEVHPEIIERARMIYEREHREPELEVFRMPGLAEIFQ